MFLFYNYGVDSQYTEYEKFTYASSTFAPENNWKRINLLIIFFFYVRMLVNKMWEKRKNYDRIFSTGKTDLYSTWRYLFHQM